LKKSGKKAELKFSFKETLRNPDIFFPILIFCTSYLIKGILFSSFSFTYDELAYSATAASLAQNGGWIDFSNAKDLFFFPPLFNWLSATLIVLGVERLIAVRTVTMLFSSGIPVLIYFILKNTGLSPKKAILGAILWMIMPGVIFFSTVGQVETPFLFFILLATLFFQKERTLKNLILIAFFLSCGVWIKETAIGFAPAFFLAFALEKDLKKLFQWTGAFVVFCSPLFVRSLFSQSYSLFYELSNDVILWGNVDFLYPFRNMLSLIGFYSFNSTVDLASIIICIIAAVGINIFAFLRKNNNFTRLLVFSNALFLIFFSVFPKKFDYYLLGILLFSLILTVMVFARNKIVMTVLAVTLAVFSVMGLKEKGNKWTAYLEAVDMLTIVAQKEPGVTIGTPFPETVRYIAQTHQLDLKTANLPFTGPEKKTCANRKDKCITDHDYFFSDDLFFLVLFCRSWPIQKENCDLKAMKETFLKLEKIESSSVFSLYRVIKTEEQIP